MLTIHPVNDVWIRIDCDDAIARELSEYFTFDVPGAHFMPAARKGWDKKIRLFKLRDHRLYRGLIPRVVEFADQRGYEVIDKCVYPSPLFEGDALTEWLDAEKLPLKVRDYQQAALRVMLDTHRGIIVSPTGSGKSFIIYLMSLLMLGQGHKVHYPVLIVVPTIGLVEQMSTDLITYGLDKNHVQTIQGGRSKEVSAPIVISTWQSIYDLPIDWYNQFDGVIVDEVHLAKSKSLAGLMEKCEKVHWRFGFTGTLDQTQCHRLILEGLFGTVTKVASTSELVKAKQLTPPRVVVCVLEYPEAVKKQLRRSDYQNEIDFLVSSGPRNKFLAYLAKEQKHNSLMLFQLVVKHGADLLSRIRKACGESRPVHYIDGSILASNREAIRRNMAAEMDAILLASYGTTQLGVNIPNLQALILAHPSKSIIRVLQSIGRILRLSEGKTNAVIYDVVDDLRIGKYVNHTFKHAEQRMAYYAAEKFPVTLKRIPLTLFAAKPLSASPNAPETTNATEPETS